MSHSPCTLSLILQVGWTPVEQSRRASNKRLIGYGIATGNLLLTVLNPTFGCAVGAAALATKGVFDIFTKNPTKQEVLSTSTILTTTKAHPLLTVAARSYTSNASPPRAGENSPNRVQYHMGVHFPLRSIEPSQSRSTSTCEIIRLSSPR